MDSWFFKAGPGTIAEALIRGLPMILNDYIPGQVREKTISSILEFVHLLQREHYGSFNFIPNQFFYLSYGSIGKGQCTICSRQWCRRLHQKFERNSSNRGRLVQHQVRRTDKNVRECAQASTTRFCVRYC